MMGAALALGLLIPAANDGPAGVWRMTIEDAGAVTAVLIRFDKSDTKWIGTVLGGIGPLEAPGKPLVGTIDNVRLDGVRFRFSITLDGAQLNFDGKALPGKPIAGSLAGGDALFLTTLESSQLAAFEPRALLQEIVLQGTPGPPLYQAAIALLSQATANKAPPADVTRWAEKAIQAAEPHGVRWQIAVTLRLVQALIRQPGYHAIALELAQRADRQLEPTDDLTVQCEVVEVMQSLFEQMNKPDDAKKMAARLAALDERGNREDLARAVFRPKVTAGSKLAERACLIELFTGVDCPPCVVADLASDAVRLVYRPSDVVTLRYHLNIPWPDPLANTVTEVRQKFYKIDGTPTTLFNGKPGAGGGGTIDDVEKKFLAFQKAIETTQAQSRGVHLQLTAERTGDRVVAKLRIRDLIKPSLSRRLRIVLVEDHVRYRGLNGVAFHRNVVRGEFGPPDGTALANPSSDHEYALELPALRHRLAAELDAAEKANPDRSFARRPLGLHQLRVVAFVQDESTREVLQAVAADVK